MVVYFYIVCIHLVTSMDITREEIDFNGGRNREDDTIHVRGRQKERVGVRN